MTESEKKKLINDYISLCEQSMVCINGRAGVLFQEFIESVFEEKFVTSLLVLGQLEEFLIIFSATNGVVIDRLLNFVESLVKLPIDKLVKQGLILKECSNKNDSASIIVGSNIN